MEQRQGETAGCQAKDRQRFPDPGGGARLGIDIGGTRTKYAVLRDEKILCKGNEKTSAEPEKIISDVADMCNDFKHQYSIKTVGVGIAGSVKNGCVYCTNLPFEAVPLEAIWREKTGIPVFTENDANCAALGELLFGSAKKFDNVVLVTLGTGIGSGVIINRKLYRGNGRAGEAGHMTIQAKNMEKCPCGRTGCWERYASVLALVRQAEKAAVEHPESILGRIYSSREPHGAEDFFEALEQKCPAAKRVYDVWLSYLAEGIENIDSILNPDIILIAGGITAQGDRFLFPLRERLPENIRTEIAGLQNLNGVLGAAMLYQTIQGGAR